MGIRNASLEDIDNIIQLCKSVNEFQVSDEVITFWSKEILTNCIQSKINPILVAEENKQIIGFIIANYNPSFKKATIENIYVNLESRAKGIGKLLLTNLLKELKKLNCEYLCSLTQSDNPKAVEFFLKNDFNKGIDCIWLDKILSDKFKK